jgi:hypothetical protein
MTAKEPPKSLSEAVLNKAQEIEKQDGPLMDLIDEIDTINDATIRSFVKSVLHRGDAFWYSPSSYIPGHHPPDEMENGGLVLHTKRVVRCALLLTNTFECSPTEQDCLVAAALLHDATKAIWRGDQQEEIFHDQLHAYTVDTFIQWCKQEDAKNTDASKPNTIDIHDDVLAVILRLIRCSHGEWSAIPETFPITPLEKALHTADFISTNLHLIADGMDSDYLRWIPQPLM